jgi:serine phosphatase RsbU (regulator of sigma subunit)
MVSDTSEHLPASRQRRRPAAAIVFACFALVWACAPSTSVADKHRQSQTHEEQAAPAQQEPRGEAHTRAEAHQERKDRGHYGQAGSEHEEQRDSGREGSGHNEEHNETKGSAHNESQGSAHKDSTGSEQESKGSAHKDSTGSEHQSGPSNVSHEPEKQAHSSSQAASASASPKVAPAASVPATAVSTPSPSTTPPPARVLVGPQRAITGRAPTAVRKARHARARAKSRATAAASSLFRIAPAAAISLAPDRASRAPHAGSGSRSAAKPGRTSPLVTTITRIVGVVPTPLWIGVGVLLALAFALGVRSRLAALRAGRLERQRGQLLEDVGLLQAALLPIPPARLGPVGTSVAYRPAAGPGAGGDFYDVFALEDGQIAVIVGDISGHGRHALPHTALVRFTLRAYLEAGLSPRGALQTAGAVLERQLGGSFATVVAATYQPRDRILVYSCAGHPPPVVLGSEPGARAIAPITICSAPPIGAGMRTGTRQTIVSIPGGAQACFYTDGVTDARVGSELLGTDRLVDTLAELGPSATAAAFLDRVAEETDAHPDDMAACILSVKGGAAAPTTRVEELELDRDEAASDRTRRFLLACGIERREVDEVMRGARVAAGRAGTALLELRLAEGSPEVVMQRDNVAPLHARHARQRRGLTVAR